MDRSGNWSLAPAFDMIYSYQPGGNWTSSHQMTVNGKRDGFDRKDLLAVSKPYDIKGATEILDQVTNAVAGWSGIAKECGVDGALVKKIAATHRTGLA